MAAKGGIPRRGLLSGTTVAGFALGAGALAAGAPASAKPGGSGGAAKVTTPPEAIVETRAGKVRGALRDGIYAFKGVPYARDTGAKARFLPPQPMASWTSVRPALSYGQVCPQVIRSGWNNSETAFVYDWDDGAPGEDCLKLNVWTPGVGSGARPVMVWIHGGGYESGSAQELPAYDGERLAKRGDVVVVSVNHRLGPFGFLDLSEIGGARYGLSANAGMLDLVAALKWVSFNIEAFGGNRANVTIFGQSGGGAKVSTLMAMPEARGLFQRAIVQSGSQLELPGPPRSRRLASEVLKELNITRNPIDRLTEVSAADLVKAGEAAKKAMPPSQSPGISLIWTPSVDGAAIPSQSWSPAAPEISADVPMLIGSTLNEYSPSLGSPNLESIGEDAARALAQTVGGAPPAAWDAVRAARPNAKPVEVLSILVSSRFRTPAVTQAQRKAAQRRAHVWVYRFDYQPPVLDGRVRAYHCAELPYCFDNVDRCLNATGGSEEARALASRMSDAWIAFARNGDPNHRGLPKWAPVSEGAVPNMLFDTRCTAVEDPDKLERAALSA